MGSQREVIVLDITGNKEIEDRVPEAIMDQIAQEKAEAHRIHEEGLIVPREAAIEAVRATEGLWPDLSRVGEQIFFICANNRPKWN